MGCKSTLDITRQHAIDRIARIDALVAAKDYKGVEKASFENGEYDIRTFVDAGEQHGDVSKWTNSMLEEVMDSPFYRSSLFDDYCIVDEID